MPGCPARPCPSVRPMPRARTRRRRRLPLVVTLGLGLVSGGMVSPAVAGAQDGGPSVSVEPFGTAPDGSAVERWTLANGDITMRVLTWGGVIQTLEAPD